MSFIQRFLCRASELAGNILDEYYAIAHPQLHPEDIETGNGTAFAQLKDYFFGQEDFATEFIRLSTVFLGLGALFCVIRAFVGYVKNDRDSELHFLKIFFGLSIAVVLMAAIGAFIIPHL